MSGGSAGRLGEFSQVSLERPMIAAFPKKPRFGGSQHPHFRAVMCMIMSYIVIRDGGRHAWLLINLSKLVLTRP